MKKSTLLSLFLCFAQILFSQTSKNVDINAGGLSSAITESERATLTHLTVTGSMNSNDFSFIRSNLPVISFVDLSEVNAEGNSIPGSAFETKQSLVKILLPKKVTVINDWAFYNSPNLEEVIFPDSLQSIGSFSFGYCYKLAKISQFPPTMRSFGSYAFYNCHALSGELIFPANIKNIPNAAFHRCYGITKIVLPDSLQTIESSAFLDMAKTSGQLVIPEKVTSIGGSAFNGNRYESCKVKSIVPPTFDYSNTFGGISIFYVPLASKTNYRENTSWNRFIIIGGDNPGTITVNMNEPGTLGNLILQQTEYLKDVNKLKIRGQMNSADMALIKSNLPDLFSLDLAETNITDIPYQQFRDKNYIEEVILPDSLETIGEQAFTRCLNLKQISIPKKVKSVPQFAFHECIYLKEVKLPTGLTSIGNYAFRYNYDLRRINFPDSLNSLGYQSFYDCHALDSVILHDRISSIQGYVFRGCNSIKNLVLGKNISSLGDYAFYDANQLKQVILPEKLTSIGTGTFQSCGFDSITLPPYLSSIASNAFYNCTSLKKIVCKQPTPPVLSSDPFGYVDKPTCVLEVPFWASVMYKQANIWSLFGTINSYSEEVKDIPISGALSLNLNVRPTGFPNVSVLSTGSLVVGGNAPFTTDNFSMESSLEGNAWGSLINNCPAMSANKLEARFEVNGNKWYFLSFPFNVNVADIRTSNNALFVVRTYNGSTRALNGGSGNWVNLNNDSTLIAGRGYIFNANTNTQFIIPATGESKNQFFRYDIRSYTLTDYPAAAQANKSWNFTGNPYPSYYDSRYIQCTAPITVWNLSNNTYSAVSLIDDKYAVKPFEAFFVQKPEDLPQISFVPEGRLNTATLPATGPSGMPAKVKGLYEQERQLINLSLSNDEFTDQTRVVINPAASTGYEVYCDASKFMSDNPLVPQLYTLDADLTRLAINERPLGEGIIHLGFYAGNSGTFRIAAPDLLNGEKWDVVLIDKSNGRETPLSTDYYNFSSTAGSFDNRFELRIQKVTSDNQEIEDGKTIISVVDEKLLVRTKTGSQLKIFTLNGVMVYSAVSTEQNTLISLPKGVYFVKVNTGVFKSVVF